VKITFLGAVTWVANIMGGQLVVGEKGVHILHQQSRSICINPNRISIDSFLNAAEI